MPLSIRYPVFVSSEPLCTFRYQISKAQNSLLPLDSKVIGNTSDSIEVFTKDEQKQGTYQVEVKVQQDYVRTKFSEPVVFSIQVVSTPCSLDHLYPSGQPTMFTYVMDLKMLDKEIGLNGLKFKSDCNQAEMLYNVTSDSDLPLPSFLVFKNTSKQAGFILTILGTKAIPRISPYPVNITARLKLQPQRTSTFSFWVQINGLPNLYPPAFSGKLKPATCVVGDVLMHRLPKIIDPDDPKTKVRLSLNASLDFISAKLDNLLIRPKKYEDIGNYTLMITLTD